MIKSHEMKNVTDFNVADSVRRDIKVLVTKTRYTVNGENLLDAFQLLFLLLGTINTRTVVWEKFTVGYFCVKFVHGKIFSSLGVSNE